MKLFQQILKSRNLKSADLDNFLYPKYDNLHDPFLLPDMEKAINRLVHANINNQKIIIYGDYDIDGLSATALLIDAFSTMGFNKVDVFIPNRFVEGYGLTIEAIEQIKMTGADLIVTVDCGSQSIKPIEIANQLGIDIIVTDHHSVGEKLPEAVAIVNPKRIDNNYPFTELAGVGVAFKLIQALQTRLPGLKNGQEKWLLDLVALGSICDVVSLIDENRILAYWGLKVLQKTRRQGLIALMEISEIKTESIKAKDLGFSLGPRLNASGRLETAIHSLNLLRAKNKNSAQSFAIMLNNYNIARREEQDIIFTQANKKISQQESAVLVISDKKWNHGIVGIVASKLVENHKKPVFILQECGDIAKGSARSIGDFSLIDAIKNTSDLLIKGGGHKMAAGITISKKNIKKFRRRVNDYYASLELNNISHNQLPNADAFTTCLGDLNEELFHQIETLEPFGNGNQEPIIYAKDIVVKDIKYMGRFNQHIKLIVEDDHQHRISLIFFNFDAKKKLQISDKIDVWLILINSFWNDRYTIEGKAVHINKINKD